MVDVFISYSRADKVPVSHLAQRIEAEGYDVWWDEELPPHKSYGDVISAKIAEAKAAIVVWSLDAAASEWVRAEADMARNQKKLIQTALGEIMPPLPFNQIQFADIGDWQGEDDHSGWRKVKASLADLCGKRESNPEAAVAATPSPPHLPTSSPIPAQPAYSAASSTPSKWPLFAGIVVALLAIVGSAAFFMGAMGGTGGSTGDGGLEPPSTGPETPATVPEPASTAVPNPTPVPDASPPPSASRGRIVGCYFWNSVDTYDGACRFVAGSDGDFTTFAMDGPYFQDVVRIDLDVSAPGTGNIEFYYPDGKVDLVKVRRSPNDRACWDGPSLTFCAR